MIRQEVTLTWFVYIAAVLNRNQVLSHWEQKRLKTSFLDVYIFLTEAVFAKTIYAILCLAAEQFFLKTLLLEEKLKYSTERTGLK